MIQGTGSHVGKSILAAALCRIFRRDGLRVAPFKAQNMSNNAFVCSDGGEIARAQTLQAMASGVEPAVEMNPVLLKPCTDKGSQVIVMGRPVKTMDAKAYQAFKPELLPVVRDCIDRLRQKYDLVIIEGAGSPAEINIREDDIVNMGAAALADAPVILVGNIDFGGVFAQFIGTLHLLSPEERGRVKGFVINKFRGDLDILKPGLDFLERETGKPVLGVLPYFRNLRLPEEDSLSSHREKPVYDGGCVRIDVIRHPRIANFTDFDALESEPDVSLRYIERPDGTIPDAVFLPGTKSTISDLRHLKSSGFAEHLAICKERGTTIVGICGGFQMMGQRIRDPLRVESEFEAEEGLGLLPTETEFIGEKLTSQVKAFHIESGAEITGYEIHMGRTLGAAEPPFRIVERTGEPIDVPDGASAGKGRIWGTYIHGLFDNGPFRRRFVNELRARKGFSPISDSENLDLDEEMDRLAEWVRASLDMDALHEIAMGKNEII